jgi:aconitate hydratase
MAQKILATRGGERGERGVGRDFIELDVDQVVVTSDHAELQRAVRALGLKKTGVEVAIAYDGRCVRGGFAADASAGGLLAHGVLFGRAGAGFPPVVHLERFASPARLCVTDEPRLAGVGGIGMLSLVVPTASIAAALVRGTVSVRAPVSVQVQLAGKLRPFVCAIDAAFELLRRGIAEVVRRVETTRGAPVVLEFAGPSARTLSVSERSVLAGLAPMTGAAGSLFVSDERTEVFLRDQRRSKAHRVLAPDAGSPCEDVVSIDLGAVDPLLLDARGEVRAVRDLRGRPVSQVLLGGDRGATLRDLFAAATLLKSKRVPPDLDFLLAVPSRQMLEVLSRAGALTDLIATGARLVEPDAGVTSGELYAPQASGVALRTSDLEPYAPGSATSVVASAEAVAYAVATGEVGDPRAFKRPVRVTVPRTLPTEDVLVERKGGRSEVVRTSAQAGSVEGRPDTAAWLAEESLALAVFDGAAPEEIARGAPGAAGVAVACATFQELRWVCSMAIHRPGASRSIRAVLAPYIPRAQVALLSAAGVLALGVDESVAASRVLDGAKRIVLPAPARWIEGRATPVEAGPTIVSVTWLAIGVERSWVLRGSPPARPVGPSTPLPGGAIPPSPGGRAAPRTGVGLARTGVSDPRRPAAQR